ncbi:MAG: hypothetical protein LBL83_02970, partial [Clostridiales bacterium]|nr:hypothetical protein [Clostridiales bacterium]
MSANSIMAERDNVLNVALGDSSNGGGAAEGEKKTEGQLLSEKLSFEKKNGWDATDSETEAKVAEFAEDYKRMLDTGKTE